MLLDTHQTSLRQSSGLLCYFSAAALSVEVPPPGEAPAIYLLVACYISLVAGLKPCSQQQAIIVLMFSAKLLRFNCGLIEFSRSQFLVLQTPVLTF